MGWEPDAGPTRSARSDWQLHRLPTPVRRVADIDVAPYWLVEETGVPPTLPPGTKIAVLVDDPVTIRATLVDHHPTAPAFGHPFGTPDGAIVISGETAPAGTSSISPRDASTSSVKSSMRFRRSGSGRWSAATSPNGQVTASRPGPSTVDWRCDLLDAPPPRPL